MRSTYSRIALLIALLALPLLLPAATVSFLSLPQTTANGTYVGYLRASVDGVVMQLICDDYYATTTAPSGPYAYTVSGIEDLSDVKFGTLSGVSASVALLHYEAAAILLAGLESNPSKVASYQYALWNLFAPSAPDYGGSSTLLAAALSAASTSSGQYDALYSRLEIYTPAGSSNQEFLRLTSDSSAVPEAGTLALGLGGFGLLGLAALIRRVSGKRPGTTRSEASAPPLP